MGLLQKPKKKPASGKAQTTVRIYTLNVFLIGGPVSRKFALKNRVVGRTVQIRGDQTLEDLHHAIFEAFGRWEQHAFEFQLGNDRWTRRRSGYVLPGAFEIEEGWNNPPTGQVNLTTLDSLHLKVGRRFGYWFDFGDDWWHQINVEDIEEKRTRGKFPKVIKRVEKPAPVCGLGQGGRVAWWPLLARLPAPLDLPALFSRLARSDGLQHAPRWNKSLGSLHRQQPFGDLVPDFIFVAHQVQLL